MLAESAADDHGAAYDGGFDGYGMEFAAAQLYLQRLLFRRLQIADLKGRRWISEERSRWSLAPIEVWDARLPRHFSKPGRPSTTPGRCTPRRKSTPAPRPSRSTQPNRAPAPRRP